MQKDMKQIKCLLSLLDLSLAYHELRVLQSSNWSQSAFHTFLPCHPLHTFYHSTDSFKNFVPFCNTIPWILLRHINMQSNVAGNQRRSLFSQSIGPRQCLPYCNLAIHILLPFGRPRILNPFKSTCITGLDTRLLNGDIKIVPLPCLNNFLCSLGKRVIRICLLNSISHSNLNCSPPYCNKRVQHNLQVHHPSPQERKPSSCGDRVPWLRGTPHASGDQLFCLNASAKLNYAILF
jgi:hypothetical protein